MTRRLLTVASYNVHSGVGLDRRFRPPRLAEVLREIDADVVALQEVSSRQVGFDLGAYLADCGGYHVLEGTTWHGKHGPFGNALLSRLPVRESRRIDLSLDKREPRGAIDATLDWRGKPLRVIATHLGLRPRERLYQANKLAELIEADDALATILMGDINEWLPRAASLRRLRERFGIERAVLTFPAAMPLTALDRVWVQPPAALHRVRAHASRLARIASDHLPLVAELNLGRH